MKYPLKQGLRWCMLSMAVSASAQVNAPVASTQLPTGGKVMSGTTSIQSVGNVLNINQSSQRSAINWNTFNVGSGAKVNFIQPSASSVTLNRVLDTNGSQILGSINANGQVFISNPNGVLFGPNSQVNVGGLIATTQNISVDDFMAGKSTFEGAGVAGSVVNQGTLEAALGGYIALLAPSVRNEGIVLAREGTVAFAAGDKTVVQFNGPQLVTVMVDKPVLDALVENKQMVRADGGLVIFSARSANAVLSSVIRNTGTVQAQTIENKNGRILLIGDMQNGSVTVDGKLDASAPSQGDGGFIETSAAQVKIANSAVVTTLAKSGKTGTWLVDPQDFIVAASGGDQTGTQLSTALGSNNVILQSASGAQTGSGNIYINDGISWSANTSLTLTATNNVNVNMNINATGTNPRLTINPNTAILNEPASGNGVFNLGTSASINLPNIADPAANNLIISNSAYVVINSLGAQGSSSVVDLQGIKGDLSGKYALGSNIDASSTSTWSSGSGFTPIGSSSWFTGTINGLGHTINNLYINSSASNVGFIGLLNGRITNLGLLGGTIQGSANTAIGALASVNNGIIEKSYSTANVISAQGPFNQSAGGLVGVNNGTISQSYSSGGVSAYGIVTSSYMGFGGLVGSNSGDILDSHSSGGVYLRNQGNMGGLVGFNYGTIKRSFSSAGVTSEDGSPTGTGGFVGAQSSSGYVEDSYSTGPVSIRAGASYVGGFVGKNPLGGSIKNSYSAGQVSFNSCISSCNGFAGSNLGTLTNTFWNKFTSGISTSNGQAVGLYPWEIGSISFLSSQGWDTNIWQTFGDVNNGYPVLKNSVLYVKSNSGSSVYGNTPSLSYEIYAPHYDGNFFTNSGGVGTPIWTISKDGWLLNGGFVSNTSAGNYLIFYSSGLRLSNDFYYLASGISNWSINPKSLNTSVTKPYDGNTTFATGFTLAGTVGGDTTPTVTGGFATVISKNAAIYTEFATNTLTLSDSNYTLTGGTISATIDKARLTVTANNASKFYGDANPALSTTVSGFVNNENLATSGVSGTGLASTSATNLTGAGPATITAGAGNLAATNYDFGNLVNGTLTINKARLTVTANNASKFYGDANPALSTTVSGFVNNENLATSGVSGTGLASTSATNLTGAGPATITAGAGNLAATNYDFGNLVNGTLTINKANAFITGLSSKIDFDGITKTLTGFTATGLVNNETIADIARSANNPNGISASTSGRFSGTYLNTPYGTANNYNLNYVSGQLVITGCPGGPPCSAIGPQTTATTISPVVIPVASAPSFSSSVVSTASPTIGAAPVMTFASSSGGGSFGSGGGSFGSGGGSTSIANNSGPTNSVNITNVISSGNTTTNTSPAAATTTTTIVNAGANPANPTTNVVNIATNAPAGSTTTSQVNIFQGNPLPSASTNAITTITQNSSSPVTASAAPNNTVTVSANPTATNTVNTVNTPNNVTILAATPNNQSPTNITGAPTTNAVTPQPTAGIAVANNPTPTPVNVTVTQPNVINPQRLADILSKKDPVEIATALPPNQVAQLSPEQVAPLVNSLNLRQLMSLTNEQIAKFEPARQAELLNIIKVLKDNPEKAADKAFTPTDKTFAQLAANGLLKEQIDTLSSRVTQINQNRTTVNIDTPQKLAELLTKKDPVEIASALPSNQVAQLTPEQAAPLINSLTVRQLLALTNEQISKLDPTRQAELLNLINFIKNNPEKAADKAYTAIDKTTAQYVANGLMKDQIDALASRVTQITQNKTTFNLDGSQRLAEILNKNSAVEIATALPSNLVPQLSSEQVAPLINTLSVKQLLSLTNEQMSKLDPLRLAELLNIINGLKDNPEKATDKTYTPEDTAVAKYAATGLLKDPIERLSLRANYIAENKFKDPLGKELADLTNPPPVPANIPVARNAPNQANRPLTAAQLAAQPVNRETPNLTPAQVAALDPKDLGPLLSQLNANQLMGITNAQMARLEGAYLNQLTALLNFVQDRTSNPVASAVPNAGGNRVNNTNIFINQPVAKLAGAALLAEQPNTAPLTAPAPPPATKLASVTLTPKQVSELDPAQLAPLINQLNANQLMAITNAQMARMDGRALNQLTILMNFVQQRAANNNGPANGNNPANAGTNTNANINVFVNQPVSRLASNALLNEQPKPNAPVGAQSFTQTNITVNLTPKQISELDPTQLAPLISQLNANQLMAITNTQMARMDSQSINQLNILMNFVQQRALNSNTNTTIYINQPVSQIAAASLMSDQPPPTQIAGAAPVPIATVPLSPQQIAGLTPSQVAPLLNRMNSRQLMAVTDTQMASLDSANLNQLITLLNFIQDSARTSPIVTNNFANRPVAGFLPPELNTTQTVTQP